MEGVVTGTADHAHRSPAVAEAPAPTPRANDRTLAKLRLNLARNRQFDCKDAIERDAAAFDYAACRDLWWNPEEFSLLYGTRLWREASAAQRLILNQLYWVAYYAQIISAEIATIFFNQTSAAALYGIEDFRVVCDTLDLESAQERTHIAAFQRVGAAVERELFGRRLFTYAMRGPYVETMIFHHSRRVQRFWRAMQLRAFTLLSSGNAFIGCQYFLIRGLRTLNGKLVQHRLSRFYREAPDQDATAIPARISFHHFQDESYHFNSSTIIGREALRCLAAPTAFERRVVDRMVAGCQRDHARFSTAINGIFWHDPALFPVIYRILRSRHFGLDRGGALDMMRSCFAEESDGAAEAARTHATARESYRAFVADLDHISPRNRAMAAMARYDLPRHLQENAAALRKFGQRADVEALPS
jgi:hypothetical protein